MPYDKALIEEQLRLLRARRASGDVEEMMFGLRADILRNIGNLADIGRRLHEPLWGVPKCVREYIDETREQLRLIAREHDLPVTEKLAFLQETRHCFPAAPRFCFRVGGRSARSTWAWRARSPRAGVCRACWWAAAWAASSRRSFRAARPTSWRSFSAKSTSGTCCRT